MRDNSSQKKVGIIIQARMNSQRLPGKVMLDICGKSVLQRIIERLSDCKNASCIVIATTDNRADDAIAGLAGQINVILFRGSENDVLSRYYHAALENDIDVIVRVTADSPLIDPEIVDEMVASFLRSGEFDYLSNTINHTFPLGFSAEIFSFKALKEANLYAREDYQREHVTPYIYEHPDKFKIKNFEFLKDYSGYRLTLDVLEDYELIKAVYENFLPGNSKFRFQDVVNFLESNASIARTNTHIRQKKLCE